MARGVLLGLALVALVVRMQRLALLLHKLTCKYCVRLLLL